MKSRNSQKRPRSTPQPRGLFLCFEGGEGSGKSTQAHRLVEWLAGRRIPVLRTREPGGTELGRTIRQLVLDHHNTALSHRAELLLYEADRAQHVEELLKPALAQGHVVITDRFEDSSTVYQGLCRGLGVPQTQALNRFATGGLRPDLVFVLDIPEAEGMARVRQRANSDGLDRLEREALEFHRKVRRGFLKLARRDPRYQVLDARQSQDLLAQQLIDLVTPRLKRRGLWK